MTSPYGTVRLPLRSADNQIWEFDFAPQTEDRPFAAILNAYDERPSGSSVPLQTLLYLAAGLGRDGRLTPLVELGTGFQSMVIALSSDDLNERTSVAQRLGVPPEAFAEREFLGRLYRYSARVQVLIQSSHYEFGLSVSGRTRMTVLPVPLEIETEEQAYAYASSQRDSSLRITLSQRERRIMSLSIGGTEVQFLSFTGGVGIITDSMRDQVLQELSECRQDWPVHTQINTSANPVTPFLCQQCRYYYGKRDGGNWLICAPHPNGPQDPKSCSDFQGELG